MVTFKVFLLSSLLLSIMYKICVCVWVHVHESQLNIGNCTALCFIVLFLQCLSQILVISLALKNCVGALAHEI